MEPTDQSHVKRRGARAKDATALDFLPDADAIERNPLPPYIRITVHTLALALLLFVAWASFSEVERVVVASGRLVNPLPNIVVQPLETSIIQKIEVRVGQVVRQGQVLATLDPTFAQADEAQLRSRLHSLDTQTRGLNAELLGKSSTLAGKDADAVLQAQLSRERQANYTAQLAKLDQNLARVAATMETNRRDQLVMAQRMKSLNEMEAMQETLMAQNFGARLQLLEARDRRLAAERELQLANNREHELRSELAALEAEKTAFTKSWRQKTMEDLLSTARDRDGINEQLQKADKRKQLVALVSPVDAVVLDMAKLSQGSVVQAAEQMFTLVPLGAELEAEIKIDALDIGYIKSGDVVHVKLDAFPFQKHGSLDGHVRTISEDAFRRENGAPGALDAYYLSRVAYGDSKLKRMPEKARLLPGMTLSAEIVVGKRSVMSYLLWPLTKAMDESIREP
ncbi:MAG: HlyD family type I secretion periplasmic adaptor subunit [Rhodoferax sp.]|nr:HlyD family type I secretion periplasmic adaptor subunit [Rhodoferax sp.]